MAKQTNAQKSVDFQIGLPALMVTDFDLDFTPEWAANFVSRAYQNYTPIIDIDKLIKFRDLDKGKIDVNDLKNVFDKRGKDNPVNREEQAQYVNTDWKPCPLYQSLNQITKGYILDELAEVHVNGIDRLSVDKKLRKRQQEAVKRYAIDWFNFIGEQMGNAPLPYNTNIDKLLSDKNESATVGEGLSILEQVKTELDDDWSFAMLSDLGALKDGVEGSHEMMIQYFIKNGNFTQRVSDEITSDIMKVRAFSFRVFTSAKDGTLQYAYVDPITINVSPFKQKDGSDIDYIFNEEIMTWGEYMKRVGGTLSLEKNKIIYEANKNFGGYRDYREWRDDPEFYNWLYNSSIRLGYFELKKQVHDTANDKYYDVIKKFYYLPIFDQGNLKSSEYVMGLGNLQDMHRFGGMLEMSKFSYVVFRDNSVQSWYEMQESNLRLLNVLYNKYQNTVAGLIPRGVIFGEETLRELVEDMMKAEEEALRENGKEMTNVSGRFQHLLQDVIKKYIESGRGIFKRRAGDADEKRLDPPTFSIQHSLYDDCRELLGQMLGIYNMMIMSLGTNAQLLGQAPKPRQAIGGIEIASESGLTMLKEMVGMYNFALSEFGSRVIYYDQIVIKEFDKKTLKPKTQRAEQMKGIIGDLGVNWQEIYEDMPQQMCGMVIQAKPTAQERIEIFNYALQLEQLGKLPVGTALMTKHISNPKWAFLWMMATVKRMERIAVDNQVMAMQQQQQMQQQQMAQGIQIQQGMANQQVQNEARIIALENQLKEQGMSKNIQERGANKERENEQKAALEIQTEAAKKQMETF